MKTEVRIAQTQDRAGWLHLRSQLWPDCPPERQRLEIDELLAGPGIVALALAEGTPVGFAEISIRVDHVEGTTSAPVPYLEGWYVSAPQRGRGIGRQLLAFAERWARQQGYRELASDAEIENEPSIRLHALSGFKEVGRTVHFVKSLSSDQA